MFHRNICTRMHITNNISEINAKQQSGDKFVDLVANVKYGMTFIRHTHRI